MDNLKIGDVVLVKNRNIKGQYFKSKVKIIELAIIPKFDEKIIECVNEVCWSKDFLVHLSCGYIAFNFEIFPIEPMF